MEHDSIDSVKLLNARILKAYWFVIGTVFFDRDGLSVGFPAAIRQPLDRVGGLCLIVSSVDAARRVD